MSAQHQAASGPVQADLCVPFRSVPSFTALLLLLPFQVSRVRAAARYRRRVQVPAITPWHAFRIEPPVVDCGDSSAAHPDHRPQLEVPTYPAFQAPPPGYHAPALPVCAVVVTMQQPAIYAHKDTKELMPHKANSVRFSLLTRFCSLFHVSDLQLAPIRTWMSPVGTVAASFGTSWFGVRSSFAFQIESQLVCAVLAVVTCAASVAAIIVCLPNQDKSQEWLYGLRAGQIGG